MHSNINRICIIVLVVAVMGLSPQGSIADEGMWLFDNPPKKLLEERYGFAPGDD